MERGLRDEGLSLDNLDEPGDRYKLGEVLGTGVYATVYKALDTQANKNVAVKIQKVTSETLPDIDEEYRIMRDLSEHPNLPDFYGVYLQRGAAEGEKDQVWFVMELCEGGPVTDLVRSIIRQNKKMSEMHIAYILKETIKALMCLHESHVMHRDVKGSNILLTKEGEVKLVDYGLSRELGSTLGRRQTCLGTPSYMAPEVVMSEASKTTYDNRADVWALGIVAIELGDGKAPFQDMHPTRALFQIVRNPPPTLYRPANWTQEYNDFIAECLVKNPEHRPYMAEVMEHPFFTELPENDSHLGRELKMLLCSVNNEDVKSRCREVKVKTGLVKKGQKFPSEPLYVEDLAGLEVISEDDVVEHLEARYKKKQVYTYVGDVLLFLNPNENVDLYGFQYYSKYKCKSRSDNEPHIFSVADSAYQDMLHHNIPQHILLAGETLSGKTTQFKHLIKHLAFLGQTSSKVGEKVQKSVDIIHALGNASTPANANSTRHVLHTQVTFSSSGKLSGAIFWPYQLEKWRVTGNRSPYHANFHFFYYVFDGLKESNQLSKYSLERNRSYRYLRRDIDDVDRDPKAPHGPRDLPEDNPQMFQRLMKNLTDLDFTDVHKETILKTIAAILLLGEVEFKEQDDGNADIKDPVIVEKVAELLNVDGKKLTWALTNYCVIERDTAARRRHSRPEALEARNVLARTLYSRLVDWIVNMINLQLSFSRAVFGDQHYVSILDMFGFECYPNNGLEQLFANCFNEQIQYFYNQRVFIAEMQEEEEEEVPVQQLQFYDNRETMDELMNKPSGVVYLLDEANKTGQDIDYVIGTLREKSESSHVKVINDEEFSVAHYTGKVSYDGSSMTSKSRDFLPPELTEVMRRSKDPTIKAIFTNKLSKSGNVTIVTEPAKTPTTPMEGKKRWGAALLADTKRTTRLFNTVARGEFSQTRGIRTAAATFRAASLEILRNLALGSTHFVRCLRTDLNNTPGGFQQSIVRQQLRALAVVDTARARQGGYSHRCTFKEFLQSYKFLAFDFDENVDETMDNCRLLLVRLKLEGYHMGKTKVFLKYYNEEYLSRLYETQVKKIIKVQSMLRTFLAKRSVAGKQQLVSQPSQSKSGNEETIPEE